MVYSQWYYYEPLTIDHVLTSVQVCDARMLPSALLLVTIKKMISVQEAQELITASVTPLAPVHCSLSNAAGKALAAAVFATVNIPAWPQSSMDGYAFAFKDLQQGKPLQVTTTIAAGSNNTIALEAGTAARIFTGAPIPNGADTVVMQEKTSITGTDLIITDETIRQGLNVRLCGSEIIAGELAMSAGTLLVPAAIGFLAGIGVNEVMVYPQPSVSIIVTGNELQAPGTILEKGQVYESNSYQLAAALQQLQLHTITIYEAADNLETVTNILNTALAQSDVVLLTGGVSVGDYDFVVAAANKAGVKQVFHKIKQKPGKPLFFGTKGHQLVFGLPGNPGSVLTCFYEYVEMALRQMAHNSSCIKKIKVPMQVAYKKNAGLTHFLKGWYNIQAVMPLQAQESYRLRSFANANCLIKIEEDITFCTEGDFVEIHLLPV
jgi:molybdopterin molybdotransferase